MGKKRFIRQAVYGLLMAMLVINMFSIKASADIGAKPSVDITVENGPDDFYIALLDNYLTDENSEMVMQLEEFDPSSETIEEYLENFSYEGWYYYSFNSRDFYFEKNSSDTYSFTYMIPSVFRILIIEKNGKVTVSEPFDRREYQATVTYDVAANTITEHWVGKEAKRIGTIALCFIFTLLAEGLMLKIFRYPFNKRNLISFLVINALTNIPLNRMLVYSRGGWPVLFVYVFFEIVICLVEATFYCFTLVNADGTRHAGKNFGYGILANVFSIVMGIVLYMAYFVVAAWVESIFH